MSPDVAPGEGATRRRWPFALGGVTLVVLLALGIGFRTQIWSRLTHLTGGPEHSWPLEPFPPGGEPQLRIAVVGDVGDTGGQQARIAAAILEAERFGLYDALLLLGDNVYPGGDPERLDELVLDPFAEVLDHGAELYAILGNHDALYSDGGVLQMELLGMPGRWWAEDLGDLLLIGLDSNAIDDPDQLAWLEETLSGSTEGWKVIALHHPPYAAGYQGSSKDVRDTLAPIVLEHGVQLVLSGHEHDYQRSVPIGGVVYIVTGSGGTVRRTGSAAFTAYSTAERAFVEINVFEDQLYLRGISDHVVYFDEVSIMP
jgi:Icc-related predicted phosphoesterase